MSTGTWKFKEVKFPRPDLEVFRSLYKDAIERIEDAKQGDDVFEILFEVDELSRRITDVLNATIIHHTIDTTDERYAEDYNWFEENRPLFEKAILEFNDAVTNSPYREYVEKRIGPMYFAKTDVKNKMFCETNIPLRQREGELMQEYEKLIGSCQEEVLGKPRSFGELQGMFGNDNREERKAAFKSFSDFLQSKEDRLEEIWSELITIRTSDMRTTSRLHILKDFVWTTEKRKFRISDIRFLRK